MEKNEPRGTDGSSPYANHCRAGYRKEDKGLSEEPWQCEDGVGEEESNDSVSPSNRLWASLLTHRHEVPPFNSNILMGLEGQLSN